MTIAPGDHLAYDEGEWHDALVVVEQGELELVCLRGGRRQFACGAVLWLAGEPLDLLHNRGDEPVVLASIARTEHARPKPGDERPPT